jgi:uncharacterized protein YaiI (UPF0178 family)
LVIVWDYFSVPKVAPGLVEINGLRGFNQWLAGKFGKIGQLVWMDVFKTKSLQVWLMAECKIIIDADACPRSCLQIARRLAAEYRVRIITVASFNHLIDNTEHITVGDEPDAADLAVMNRTQAGDIVVTQDWGLAALVLGRKAWAIAPGGQVYRDSRIESMLEERNILAKHRRGGGRTKGPAKRRPRDDAHFAANLERLLQM